MANYTVKQLKSKYLNDTNFKIESQRQPGYCWVFNRIKDDRYRCVRCFELGKQRSITIQKREVIGWKNVEDEHHDDCLPQKDSTLKRLTSALMKRSGKGN